MFVNSGQVKGHIHIMEFYMAVKSNEAIPYVGHRMFLKIYGFVGEKTTNKL